MCLHILISLVSINNLLIFQDAMVTIYTNGLSSYLHTMYYGIRINSGNITQYEEISRETASPLKMH